MDPWNMWQCLYKWVCSKLILRIDILSSSCETGLRRVPANPIDDWSLLVQVMACCRQTASHYLNQCLLRSMPPYGVARSQWDKWQVAESYNIHAKCWITFITIDQKHHLIVTPLNECPDSKVHGAYMGRTWGRLGPGEPHVWPMNLAIRVRIHIP